MNKVLYIFFFITIFLINNINGQNSIEGNIYDQTHYIPLPNVKVLTTSGYKTKTDSVGNYNIRVKGKNDSIWFSYNGKNTLKYPVDTIKYTYQFNVGLSVKSPLKDDKHWLPPVTVFNKSYYQDSIENREAYARIFHPDKGGFRITDASPGTFGAGVDFDALVNSFRFKYNKRQEMYRRNIVDEEQYKYVDHRFTKKLVANITKLDSADIEIFMKEYRPEYFALTRMNDVTLANYILMSKNKFLANKNRIYNDPFSQTLRKKKNNDDKN